MLRWFRKKEHSVSFEEILLDASNLPSFNQGRLEGKREVPITRRNVAVVSGLFLLVAFLFLAKLFSLQVIHGAEFKEISEKNTLNQTTLVAERGVIYDRNHEMLAWNEPDKTGAYSFPVRAYTDRLGMGQLLGYVSYPLKDKHGFYYRTDYVGRNGVEAAFNDQLAGKNGRKLVETDALGHVVAEHVVDPAVPGKSVTLSVDTKLSEAMYNIIKAATEEAGFRSGAGAIMDVKTGEIVAMTSFPSYDPEVMANGDDVALIEKYNKDKRFPFLNKVFAGAYAPGSIVKPFMAYAGLKEGVITPDTHIYSNGMLTIPNRYNPNQPSHFADWRPQGDMTVRQAIAYSSDVFFYILGGGLPEIAVPQAGLDKPFVGLGIKRMDEYFDFFHFGHKTGIKLANEQAGTVPSPEWKEATFHQPWLLGNTYHTAIGQFGWQVTPLQMLVAYGALATGGKFFTPHIIKGEKPEYVEQPLDPDILKVVHEGMHMTVVYPGGTARGLEKPYVTVAGKSGTAELGTEKSHVNSWAAGFWPNENPRYSFILLMEHAPHDNTLGATTIMGRVFDWIHENEPQYFNASSSPTTTH